MDSTKVQAIHEWKVPRSARAVRGFLGLAGYYRKFIHNYSSIAAPLTALLKKEGFAWGAEAASTFLALKEGVTSASMLVMPAFDKPFVVECDTSSHGFGVVLIQEGHPIAFSAVRWHLDIKPWQPTSVSSLVWSRLCATGGHTSRGAVSQSRRITTA
jgi:hypothetical protein